MMCLSLMIVEKNSLIDSSAESSACVAWHFPTPKAFAMALMRSLTEIGERLASAPTQKTYCWKVTTKQLLRTGINISL